MEDSILQTIMSMLGAPDDFELDVLIHINSTFMTLNQLGVGPYNGYAITSKSDKWSDYIGPASTKFEAIKTYIYLKVKLAFDPPINSTLVQSIKDQISELEWRLNTQAESKLMQEVVR